MNLEIKITGTNNLLRNFEAIENITLAATVASIGQTQIDIANDAKENHTFKNRTGNLEASIQPLPIEIRGTDLVGPVVAGMVYAKNVEEGTSRSSPYPFMHPALNRNKGNLRKYLSKAISKANKSVCKIRDPSKD